MIMFNLDPKEVFKIKTKMIKARDVVQYQCWIRLHESMGSNPSTKNIKWITLIKLFKLYENGKHFIIK